MSFLTDLATHLKTVFAKVNHNHDSSYETKNSNIQSHITNVSNPHGTTATQIGLGNVTNDAQVKKSASSVDGNIAVWSGTTGDSLGAGYEVETALTGSTTKIPRADAVKTYVDNLVAGFGQGLLTPVADLAELKAINTTNSTATPDKVMINVETLGLYRLDRDSSDDGNDTTVVAPTTGTGRWLKMSNQLTDHNLMSGIQGGAVGQYNHITNAQLAAIPADASGTNQMIGANNVKISNITSTGLFPVLYIEVTAGEWTAFDNTLNS